MGTNNNRIFELAEQKRKENSSSAKKVFELLGHEFDDSGNILVNLKANDGKDFGKVTYDAYKAIESGTLDSYQPKNESEKNTIATYRKSPVIALKMNDGKEFGKISYDAYTAITNNKIDDYTPVSDEEKKAIADFKIYADEKAKEDRINSNSAFARYGIDPVDFDFTDLYDWVIAHNHKIVTDDSGRIWVEPEYKGGFLGIGRKKQSTDQEDADAKVLYELALNNVRYEQSQTDYGAFVSAAMGAADGMTFGLASKLADWQAEKNYHKAGLAPDYYIKPSEAFAKTISEHMISNIIGDIGGSLITYKAADTLVKTGLMKFPKYASLATEATKGVKRAQKVKNLIDTAATVSSTSAIGSAIRQDWKNTEWYKSVGNVLLDTTVSTLGAYVGVKLSSVVGERLGYVLQNKTNLSAAAIKGLVSGTSALTFSGTAVGLSEIKNALQAATNNTDYKPDVESIVTNMAVLAIYSGLKSYVDTKRLSGGTPVVEEKFEYFTEEDMSSPDALKKKMRQYTKEYHPDKFHGVGEEAVANATQKMQAINAEYVRAKNKVAVNIMSEIQKAQSDYNSSTKTTPEKAEAPNAAVAKAVEFLNDAYATDSTTASVASSKTMTKSTVTPAPTDIVRVGATVLPTATEAIPAIQNANDFTDELSEEAEILDADIINTFSPEGASKGVKSLESALVEKGASDIDRQNIVSTAAEVEATLSGTGKSLKEVVSGITKITNNTSENIKNEIGASPNYWALFNVNLKAVTNAADNIADESFIRGYAGIVADVLKTNNSLTYQELNKSGEDVGTLIADYTITGKMPDTISSSKALENVSVVFNNIVTSAASQLGNAHMQIYGVKEAVIIPIAVDATIEKEVTNNDVSMLKKSDDNDIMLVQEDTKGNKLSAEQQERYKNSVAKDDSGKLMVVYHGTPNGNINTFDKTRQGSTDKGLWGKGFYFAVDKRKADIFAVGEQGTVIECYLNITNPFYINSFKSVDEICDYLGVQKPAFQGDERCMFKYSVRDNNINLNTRYSSEFSDAVMAKGHDSISVAPFGDNDTTDVASTKEIVVFDADKIEILSNNNSNKESVNDESREISENDSRYNQLQTQRKTGRVDEEVDRGLVKGTGEVRTYGSGYRNVETRTLEELLDNGKFEKLRKFVGNEISRPIQMQLLEKYKDDSRVEEDYEFSSIITYDMLTDANNELRGLFEDNLKEYFNQDTDISKNIAGDSLSQNVIDRTRNSVVKNEHGQLIPVYHGTGERFDTFSAGDIGIHFGSYAQAVQRTVDKGIENPIYIKAYLNIENPLVIDEDCYAWNAFQMAQKLSSLGVLTNEEALGFVENSKRNLKDDNIKLAELLKNKGYDGIVYNNRIEAVNGKSYIVFDNEQIVRVQGDAEAFRSDTNGKIRFNQMDIDYTNNQYREESFNILKQGRTDTETQKGGIVGKYGIHKKNNGYFGVNLLSSGMDIAAFESFDDALKFATYTNENVSFNDVFYTKNTEGQLTIEATPEFMQYGEQIKAVKNEKAYLQTEIATDDDVTETPENESAVPYTDKEKQNWENSNTIIVYESDEQFESFVERVLNNEDTHKKIYFGKIPDATAQMVLDKTGVDVSGHNIALKGYEIRKILLNSHGDEEAEVTRGQEPITTDDLKNIPSVITNPDDVNLSEKEYEGKPALLFEKTIDGKNYVVAYVSRKHHDIAIQTMYKKRSLATAENADALSSTPETTSSTASNSIVSQDNDIVNSSVRTDAENDTSKVYDVAYFEKLGSDIRKGESVSLKDVRTAVDAILLNRGEAIKAELSQLKNDELKKHLSIYDRGRITKKAEMVDSIYTDMLSSLYYALSGKETITYIYDGTGFEAQQSKMLFDVSRELTEESFNKRLAENAEKYKKQLAAREEKLAKVKNPQTLEDYAYKKRYFGLSDEETIQYENLYAEERKKAREDKKAAKTNKDTSGADAFFANTDNYTIEKTTHTKTGDDVWVVRPTSRLEMEQWKHLNEQMKALGGSYWRGNQGWNFKKDPTATLPSAEETETAKGSTNAEKLRTIAESMQKAIDDKFRDRLTNTAKRAREAASAESEGERLKRLQDTINNIADALENGENTLLDKIDSKAQVETLMSMLRTGRRNRISETMSNMSYDERLQEQDKPYSSDDANYAEYPLTKVHENIVSGYLRAAEGKTGYKQIADRLKKAIKSAKNGYVSIDAQLLSDIEKIVQNLSPFYEEFWNDGVAERKRLTRMGIENVVELRAYLREFIKFLPGRNIEAEKQRAIKEKERQLANAKIEGFFPTPKAIVEKMLDEAAIKPGEKVLEPSAGKGNIADAIKESHPDNALDVVEWNASLNELLTEKGHNVVGVDFLQHSGEYDKIVMNPPFEKGQDIDHIRHAYSLLNDGGRVVCIMSEGPFFRNDKKATEFRNWLDSLGGVSEKLPEGAFKSSERSTGVNTRLVVIDKVASDTKSTKSNKVTSAIENEKYSYSLESEDNYERERNLLHNDSEQWYAREYPGEQVAGLAKAAERGSKTAEERRDYTERLKPAQLDNRVVTDRNGNKHTFVEIKPSAWNNQMNQIADYYAQKDVNVHFIKGSVQIESEGENKTANAMRIGNDIYISYDNAFYTPEQLSMHEYIHIKYGNPEFQKTVQDVLEILPKHEYNRIVDKVKKAYGDIIEDPYTYEEELICDVLSGMTPSSLLKSGEIVLKFWARESADLLGYDASQYAESIDTGNAARYIDLLGFGDSESLGVISNDEYAMVSKAIMAKNAGLADEKLKPVDYVYAANNFYIYKNHSLGIFSDVHNISIVGNEEFINDIRGELDNGTYRGTGSFASRAKRIRSRGRSDNRSNGRIERESSHIGNDRFPFRESQGHTIGYPSENSRNTTNDKINYSFSTIDSDTEQLTPERRKQIHEQYEKDRVGVQKPTQKQWWGERAAWVAHNMTRVFPDIPERGEKGTFFAEFRKSMLQWKSLPTTASFMVQDKLNQMTDGLTPEEFRTFSELVYFLDLQEEAQIQKEKGYTEILLPNEIKPNEVDAIVKELDEEATENVKRALEKRQRIWETLKSQYIELNQYIGFDTDGKFKRKNYYHHQVIEYMNDGGKGTGSREIGIKAGRGWLKERHGSTKAINTDFLAVEYKAMLQMQYDIYIAETLGKIKQQYDIKPQLESEAFKNNKKLLNDIIAKECTDKEGNLKLDSKGNPDSETYRQQKWYNSRIMFGFSGLFDLAERGELPTYDGEYARVVETLKRHELNVPGLYKYVSAIAATELQDNATDEQEHAVISARTVMKYTSQKKAWIKELLAEDYQTWETIAESMSDTHSIHQPRRGNYFYTKTVVDEDAFNKAHNEMVLSLASGEVDLGNVDLNKLFTQYADTVRLTGAAYEQWVLPNEIVTTMQDIANPKQINVVNQASRSVLSAWKGWATSVNPLRTVKFGLRNLFGDLDAVIAGNPKVVMYSQKAVKEIYEAMRHKNYSDEFMEWVQRGGYSSMIFANEMDTEMQDKLFSHLKEKKGVGVFKIPVQLFEKYYNGVENVHNFREAILRYSSYLYFKEAIKRNSGEVKDFVASNKYIVKGLNSVEDKAYQLSKDLLGAYDEVGRMGQALRRHAIPFYSFTETNLKRYYRMFENIITSDDSIPKKAGRLLLKGLMVNMLGLLIAAWNRAIMKDEDDKLPPSARNVPHITLGKIGDNIYAFRQLGSFNEILEWFGLEDYKWSEEDIIAPVDKAWGMVTPFFKLPIELATGLNFYPSLTQPRAIRDKWQHFFNSFGVDDIYNEVTGKPTKGAGEIVKGSFVYDYDYKESAYYEILDIKRKYQKKTDNTIYGATEKSNALYYMKTAVRYKDKDAALKYLDEYFENGGTGKGIVQSFATLNPMYGYTSKDSVEKGEAFIASLTDDEREKLKIAQDYYENDLMLPEDVIALLKKKDITNDEAKNVLKKYITAKCK